MSVRLIMDYTWINFGIQIGYHYWVILIFLFLVVDPNSVRKMYNCPKKNECAFFVSHMLLFPKTRNFCF